MLKVGSELQFTTSFCPHPVDPLDRLDPLDPLDCRNLVFRLRETITFEKFALKVVATLERFSWEASRHMFFTMDREGRKREGFRNVYHSRTFFMGGLSTPVFYNGS